jgi:hypothetical protein
MGRYVLIRCVVKFCHVDQSTDAAGNETMITRKAVKAELDALSVEQLREYRANEYSESLADYSEQELRELVYDIWTTDGYRPLARMTKNEIVAEILSDIDEEATDDELSSFLEDIRKHTVGGKSPE